MFPALAQPACPPLPGVERLAERPQTRFVAVGELHGTVEAPGLAGDIVCHLSATRPVTFAFEWPPSETAALDAYMKSDGGEAARREVLGSIPWRTNNQYGLRSVAMFALLERLRTLRATGRDVRVTAIRATTIINLPQSYGELEMAGALARAADATPQGVVVTLLGNLHASKAPLVRETIRPAVSYLVPQDVVALVVAQSGGSAWVCMSDGCGPHQVGDVSTAPRGIVLHAETRDGFDGVISAGRPLTASPPAAPEAVVAPS